MTDEQTGDKVDHSTVAAAFAAAQGELTNPTKDKSAKIATRGGGEYSYTYADLASILDHVRPVLRKHGLSISQDVQTREDGAIGISTTILHESGESLTMGPLFGPAPGDWQGIGSAITYARRYALTAALGIAADDDTDTNRTPDPRPLSPEKAHAYEQRMETAPDLTELGKASSEVNSYELTEEQAARLRAAYVARRDELRVREPGPAQRATAQRAAANEEPGQTAPREAAKPEPIEYDTILPLLEATDLFDDRAALKVFHDEHDEAGLLDRTWDDSGLTLRKHIEARARAIQAAERATN